MSRLKNDKDQYKKYLSGNMSEEESHAFEREVLNDPFEQEALEGMEEHGVNEMFADISQLQERVFGKKKAGFNWMRIAAAVALLMVSSLAVWLVVRPLDQENALAMEQELPTKEESAKLEEVPAESEIEQNDVEVDLSEVADNEPVVTSETELANEAASSGRQDASTTEAVVDLDIQVAEVASDEFAAEEVEAEPVASVAFAVEDIRVQEGEEIRDALQNQTSGLSVSRAESVAVADDEEKKEIAQSADKADLDEVFFSEGAPAPKAKKAVARSTAPSTTLSGKITDESGQALPGVNIIIKGTTTGTVTDLDGNYQLSDVKEKDIQVAMVGFQTQEIAVGDRDILDITLSSDATELAEVVVTGVATERRERALGYGVSDSRISKRTEPQSGFASFNDYVQENLVYPEAALENEIEGVVILQVTISSLGAISDLTVKKSLGYGCDQEAIRLVREGPNWESALRNGAPIEDQARVRVRFKIK